MATIQERIATLEAKFESMEARVNGQGSWFRWAILILATVVASYAGAWAEHAMRR